MAECFAFLASIPTQAILTLTFNFMKETIKNYIVGAAVGIAIYIIAKNCGFELIIVI